MTFPWNNSTQMSLKILKLNGVLHMQHRGKIVLIKKCETSRPFTHPNKESKSNDVLMHFEESLHVHNKDRSPNAAQ